MEKGLKGRIEKKEKNIEIFGKHFLSYEISPLIYARD